MRFLTALLLTTAEAVSVAYGADPPKPVDQEVADAEGSRRPNIILVMADDLER